MVCFFLFSMINFNDVFEKVGTIRLDSVDYSFCNQFYVNRLFVWKDYLYFSTGLGGLWKYDKKTGSLIEASVLKKGQAPEEIHTYIRGIDTFGDFVRIIENAPARAIEYRLTKDGNLVYKNSFLAAPGYCEGIGHSTDGKYILNVNTWDYNYRKKIPVYNNMVLRIYNEEGKLLKEFYKPPKKMAYYHWVWGEIIEFSVFNDTVWVIPKFMNQIEIYTMDGKHVKRVKFNSHYFTSPKRPYRNPYKLGKEREKHTEYKEKWLSECTALSSIITDNRGLRFLVYLWGYGNKPKRFFIIIMDKNAHVLAEVPVDFRLLGCDEKNNFYFLEVDEEASNDFLIGIYKLKNNIFGTN